MISLDYDDISLLFNFSATSGSSIKSQVLDLKTLPIFSPLKISVKKVNEKSCFSDFEYSVVPISNKRLCLLIKGLLS